MAIFNKLRKLNLALYCPCTALMTVECHYVSTEKQPCLKITRVVLRRLLHMTVFVSCFIIVVTVGF